MIYSMKLYAPFAHLTIPFHCGGHYTIAPPSDICVYVWHHATSLRCGIFFLFGLKYFLISSWSYLELCYLISKDLGFLNYILLLISTLLLLWSQIIICIFSIIWNLWDLYLVIQHMVNFSNVLCTLEKNMYLQLLHIIFYMDQVESVKSIPICIFMDVFICLLYQFWRDVKVSH